MTTKEKADALVEKHHSYSTTTLKEANIHAIKSVEHTIEILEQTNKIIDEIGRPLEVQLMIEQQTEILQELKSRI